MVYYNYCLNISCYLICFVYCCYVLYFFKHNIKNHTMCDFLLHKNFFCINNIFFTCKKSSSCCVSHVVRNATLNITFSLYLSFYKKVKSFFKTYLEVHCANCIKKLQLKCNFYFYFRFEMELPAVWTILSGWTATLTPVLTGIQSVMTEFIPYLIYLSLGVLIATLGFVAIKWLMSWTSRRVTGVFSSKRRRR